VTPPIARAQARVPQYDLPARLSQATRDTLERVIDSAKAGQLPIELLLAKVAEGALKGATETLITRAVRTLVRELEEARRTLPPNAATGTLAAGASALHAGVTGDDVRRLWTGVGALPEQELESALVTLADLVASRVPAADATNSVSRLLRRRVSASEMEAFRAGVVADIQSGLAPETALDTRARAIKPSGPRGRP
jgi:hypothetical protein